MAGTEQASADLVESTLGGLGTITLPMWLVEKRSLKVLSLDGVKPSANAIANGGYPWFKTFYLLTKPASLRAAQRFMNFVFSAKGRGVVTAYEYWFTKNEVK